MLDRVSRDANHRILARLDGFHVDLDGARDAHAVIACPPRQMRRIRAGDERLGGRASGVDASPAEEVAFNDGYLVTRRYKAPRQRRSGLSGSNDDRIEFLHRCEPRLIWWISRTSMSANRLNVDAIIGHPRMRVTRMTRSTGPQPHTGECAVAPDPSMN